MTIAKKHLVIKGRVQGVGYRDALQAEARNRGITGWVRNRTDGTVEAVLHGPADLVQALIEWAGRGPASARVSDVHVDSAVEEPERSYSTFERWPTR